MIATSKEYQAAVVGSPRRVEILAIVDLSDPDMRWGPATTSPAAPWSNLLELHDKEMDPPKRYATLERNRWLLDGSFSIFPTGYKDLKGMAYVSHAISGPDGALPAPVWVEQSFENVRILQMLSVFFSSDPADGVPADFRVDVYSGSTIYYSKEFTGNRQTEISITGFTVQDPTAIRVTCTRMSLPSRRFRVLEILTGLYERWTSRMLATFSCVQQGEFSCLSLPYGSVTLSMDNHTRRFDPRRKDGIFQSIEERQGVDVYIGVRLPSGVYEHVRLGVYYMIGDGWKTSDNSLSMKWYLVDIVGLLSDRTFIPPQDLPTTLAGWLEALAAQLGENFRDRWSCDPNYANKPVTALNREAVTDKKCGDMIRWICQASGTWPRADAETGKLCAEPLWSQGNKVTLGNLVNYPTMKANQSIAALLFTLSDGAQYVLSGNSTTSEQTVSITNPFLHTHAQALEAARLILAQYGGNVFELTGRGDPASEIGDIDTVWLDKSTAATGRRKSQTLQFQNGVLQGCRSTLIQADGSYLWEGRAELTGSGTWRAPAGAAQLRLFLVGRGGDGQDGTDGSFYSAGVDGADGLGALVWAGVIDINPEQVFEYSVSDHAVFGVHTSANGKRYPYGYSDIGSGKSYARTGVRAPLPGSGDGGKGGTGGNQGSRHTEPVYDDFGYEVGSKYVTDVSPGRGTKGVPGESGCIVVYWDKMS